MKSTFKLATALTVTAFLAACGSTANKSEALNANIPAWVLQPQVEDGLASSTCVPSSGQFSIDRDMAASQSRIELARQLSLKVKAMDKTYQERINVGDGVQTGATFSSVSKQLTDQALVGSRVIKTEFAEFDGKNQLCVLTALGSSSTKELFDNIMKSSERNMTLSQEEMLYQEFKAQKAQDELEAELQKNKG